MPPTRSPYPQEESKEEAVRLMRSSEKPLVAQISRENWASRSKRS